MKMHVELQEDRLQQQKLQDIQQTITRLEKDREFFQKQTEKIIDNLLEQKQQAEYPKFQRYNDKFQFKFVTKFAKNLIISDSSTNN